MIRGVVYQVDLGQAPRGHEQRGRRYGLVVSPSDMALSVVTVVPTSTSAGPAVYRPEMEVAGRATRFLVDQVRVIDIDYIGEPVDYLTRDQMAQIEHTLANYLGLLCPPAPD
ncbi:transcriptional modulator of MazE/toxin, MazF [Xylanimonas cellulosilytica DSM 15894]|uniref:Transcriptional modulator of MazE/toxin, MazF n=1 Tax=Xylanimonas cellulosilytica (strain DSM 15894 / JCM 12276 / CECT 5975 / KCTC 9989 / LMG 20990 / NBRC 107835 / XIL07) TaxID=446471 RepID=D1BST1_XYLCX|nr:type II toxin-antitoxin system PemK/MazF family toxin [Xylanimonas cellulosilytica]ACZ30773.1 transcriptional modulator of MazE/toxin, MazF [Xylanimonas cellulosilytica DSM 15894]